MDQADYKKKMEDLLEDPLYRKILKDPTSATERNLAGRWGTQCMIQWLEVALQDCGSTIEFGGSACSRLKSVHLVL